LHLVDVDPNKIKIQNVPKEDTWHEVKNPKKSKNQQEEPIIVPKPKPKPQPKKPTVSNAEAKAALSKYLSNPKPDLKPGITARKREQLAFIHGEALHEGIKNGNIVIVVDALKAGADPNRSDPKHEWNKEIPLGLASRLGYYDIIRLLLMTPGIKVDLGYLLDSMKEESPVTSIFVALTAWKRDIQKRDLTAAKKQEKIVRLLISKGAKLSEREKNLLNELEGKEEEEEEEKEEN